MVCLFGLSSSTSFAVYTLLLLVITDFNEAENVARLHLRGDLNVLYFVIIGVLRLLTNCFITGTINPGHKIYFKYQNKHCSNELAALEFQNGFLLSLPILYASVYIFLFLFFFFYS